MKYFLLLITSLSLIGCTRAETPKPVTKETVIEENDKIIEHVKPTHEYFNDEFELLLKEGKISGADFGIGDTAAEIRKTLGEPDYDGAGEGAKIIRYGNVSYIYPFSGEDKISGIEYKLENEYYLEGITGLLGKPDAAEVSEINGQYFVLYKLDGHKELWAYAETEKEDSPISVLKLKYKPEL